MDLPVKAFYDVLPTNLDAVARGGIASSQAMLPPSLRTFHQDVLRIFLSRGAPLSLEHLYEAARRRGLDLDQALANLSEADLVHVDPDRATVTVAYPLSGLPSPHEVSIAGGLRVTAMCAIDALGIPLMIRSDATITSTDPTTWQPIRVEFRQGRWIWQPESTVVVLATDGCGGPIASACASTAFHTSREQATAYLAAHPDYTGRVLAQTEAVTIAESEFGPLLSDADLIPTKS